MLLAGVVWCGSLISWSFYWLGPTGHFGGESWLGASLAGAATTSHAFDSFVYSERAITSCLGMVSCTSGCAVDRHWCVYYLHVESNVCDNPAHFVGLRPGRPHSLHTTEQKTVGAGKLLDDLVHRLWLEPERLDAVLVARTPAKLVAALKSLPRMKGVLRFEHALDYFILCEKDAGHRLFQVPLTKRAVDWAINGGAAEGLKPGHCLTSLSEATRKPTGQAPDRWPQTSGKLPKAPARAVRSVWKQATA